MNKRKLIILGLVILLFIGVIYTTVKSLDQKSGKAGGAEAESIQENTLETAKVLPSPDNRYTAFVIGDQEQSLYVGEGKDFAKATKVNTGLKDYTNISWNPDSRYLFAGSTESNKGVILKPEDLIPRFSVERYMSGPFWEPQRQKVCFTVKKPIRKESGLYVETTDILVIDLNKQLKGVHFVRGNLDYYYKVDSWEQDGRIKYSRISMIDDKVIEQLSSEFAHHLFRIDIGDGKKKELAMFKDLAYFHFNSSPDRRWLSMVELTKSTGEAEEGIPFFYDAENGKLLNLQEEYNTSGWKAKWFNDSTRIMLNERTVYDLSTGVKTTYEFPEDIVFLGGSPSPDGSKIAVFACKRAAETESKGEPLDLYLLDSETKETLKVIKTALIPYGKDKRDLNPIGFAWVDEKNLIVESWTQEEYTNSSLWTINTGNDSVHKYCDAGQNPFVSPDGQRIAFFAYEYKPEDSNPSISLRINSKSGASLAVLNLKDKGFSSVGSKLFWDSSAQAVLTTAYSNEEGVPTKYLVYWDLEKDKYKAIKVEQAVNPLYLENGKIVCVNGSIL